MTKERGQDKLSRIPVKIETTTGGLDKPAWIRVQVPSPEKVKALTTLLHRKSLKTVCEEASCPNLYDCFGHGTATFMIMGDKCTRRCAFCAVAHGRPDPLDPHEPIRLAEAVREMQLKHVVITSVDRDDLLDGGAGHFVACIQAIRQAEPRASVEILVPDFRGRMEKALEELKHAPPDVFNHNIETIPRLYRVARAGADYRHSLQLLQRFSSIYPQIPTKSGLMLGMGESLEEVLDTLQDLRNVNVSILTLGQYLQPSPHHLPIVRYLTPEEFSMLKTKALALGFLQVNSGPLVRSSYHAHEYSLLK